MYSKGRARPGLARAGHDEIEFSVHLTYKPVLPTCFVIGAAKSGTTSLHHYLGLHPEIHAPAKEPSFFCREEDGPYPPSRVATREGYEALFESEALVRVDCSPAYSQHPRRSRVPERINELVPTARFLYLVRDPVERVVAQIQQGYSFGSQTGSLREALGEMHEPLRNRYLIPSLYATQLERYLEVFPQERILVVDSSELKSDRAATLSRIFFFLGVDDAIAARGFAAELNPGSERRLPSPSYTRLRDSPLAMAWRRLPQRVRVPMSHRVRRALTSPALRPSLDDDLRLSLEEIFRPEVERLRSLTGLSFESWSL